MDINWKIEHFDQIESTNAYLYDMVIENPNLKEGFGVSTDFQNSGKGQRGNAWESDQEKNILLSVLLKPGITAERQFLLSQIISLAIAEFLIDLDIDHVKIKWPNDIYVGDMKIAGILIQNILSGKSIRNSIIGIGLNVNQILFNSDAPNPTSLKSITGMDYDVSLLRISLLNNIEKYYADLFRIRKARPQSMYTFLLYRLNELASFKDKAGKIFDGKIKGIDDIGRLAIERFDGIEHFNFNEIKYLI